MKKIIIVPCFLLLFLMPATLTYAKLDYYQLTEESKKELMMDLFFSLLLPNVQRQFLITIQIILLQALRCIRIKLFNL
ncbi:hypothetical protein ACFVR1_04640 [Psychrobacillus sp. NPDC058041]|uniref:hypothetical protein n=1 Tax=Psychrobacillus sp. NPDC058041 TaxID=3346310 RepID=UPI0036DDA9BA